jgi:hypothetical protein
LAAHHCATSFPASAGRAGCGGVARRRPANPALQARAKFIQIQQNPAKRRQSKSKESACIGLDSLVRNEPFQWVALTPRPFFLLAAVRIYTELELYLKRADVGRHGKETISLILIFRKQSLRIFCLRTTP